MSRVCTIPDCDARAAAPRGWCWKHYERWRKHGDPMWQKLTLPELYESQIDRSDSDGCHPWRGRLIGGGGEYGVISVNRRNVPAHRFGYELHIGPIPDGLHVRHSCDNPPCQNPKHWLLGTSADNHADMVERRRSTFGERNPNAKLTEAQVLQIRAEYAVRSETHDQIAERYGVCRPVITGILNRRSWAWLQPAN